LPQSAESAPAPVGPADRFLDRPTATVVRAGRAIDKSSGTSPSGCGQEALRGTGGDGLFYCFAAD
jgi:hypothetical protein